MRLLHWPEQDVVYVKPHLLLFWPFSVKLLCRQTLYTTTIITVLYRDFLYRT